jgi:hypothetical protein
VSLALKHVILSDGSQIAFRVALSFLLYRAPGPSQETQPEDSSLPQYDLHEEIEIKRVIDGVNLLSLGTRKAFGEPIIKNGDDKLHIYLLSMCQYLCANHFKRRWASVSKEVARFLVPVQG